MNKIFKAFRIDRGHFILPDFEDMLPARFPGVRIVEILKQSDGSHWILLKIPQRFWTFEFEFFISDLCNKNKVWPIDMEPNHLKMVLERRGRFKKRRKLEKIAQFNVKLSEKYQLKEKKKDKRRKEREELRRIKIIKLIENLRKKEELGLAIDRDVLIINNILNSFYNCERSDVYEAGNDDCGENDISCNNDKSYYLKDWGKRKEEVG